MNLSRRLFARATLLTPLVALMAGCVVAEPRHEVVEVVAPSPPPAPRLEVIPEPPAGQFEMVVWDPGHWHWNGREYVWIGGHYVDKPHREAVWVSGHWAERHGEWVWVGGHWR